MPICLSGIITCSHSVSTENMNFFLNVSWKNASENIKDFLGYDFLYNVWNFQYSFSVEYLGTVGSVIWISLVNLLSYKTNY